jgi:hypothetical protein
MIRSCPLRLLSGRIGGRRRAWRRAQRVREQPLWFLRSGRLVWGSANDRAKARCKECSLFTTNSRHGQIATSLPQGS